MDPRIKQLATVRETCESLLYDFLKTPMTAQDKLNFEDILYRQLTFDVSKRTLDSFSFKMYQRHMAVTLIVGNQQLPFEIMLPTNMNWAIEQRTRTNKAAQNMKKYLKDKMIEMVNWYSNTEGNISSYPMQKCIINQCNNILASQSSIINYDVSLTTSPDWEVALSITYTQGIGETEYGNGFNIPLYDNDLSSTQKMHTFSPESHQLKQETIQQDREIVGEVHRRIFDGLKYLHDEPFNSWMGNRLVSAVTHQLEQCYLSKLIKSYSLSKDLYKSATRVEVAVHLTTINGTSRTAYVRLDEIAGFTSTTISNKPTEDKQSAETAQQAYDRTMKSLGLL